MVAKEFKSESKRLLEMMINSIYTHKEIFLRELISNASDAIDKLYYLSLKDENIAFNRDDFYIRISADKEKRLLTITDTGIGMTREELEENLGTIAKSGSLSFKNTMEKSDDVDIIGKFGVGFYSAFMVSDCVSVTSKRFASDEAYLWQSQGADGYTIAPCEKDAVGTQIVMSIKQSTEDENYDEFLDEYTLTRIVKKYSDYIKYPIKMQIEKTKKKEDSKEEYETYFEDEILNSQIPIWKKSKTELSNEDYNNFYKSKFFDFEDPIKTVHAKAEGIISYTALLYIPSKPPFDYYTKEFEKGLQLYANGVLIMEKCADLLPDYFGFVKGLVDSADLSLNISREILQHDRQLKAIAANIKKKVKSELLSLLNGDREKYEKFYESFGRQLKYGLYDNFGADKDVLLPLILFFSSHEKKLVSLKEYVERMKEDQKYIYYACGESVEKISKLPQAERILEEGYEILYLSDDVDEFAIKVLGKYEEKEFKSVSSADHGMKTEEKKDQNENKELFDFMKEALEEKVKEVKASDKLKSHPVCLTSEGELSLEMEKVLSKMPMDGNAKAERVLEINTGHAVFETIKKLFVEDKDKLKKYTDVLYSGALLIEGLSIEDPVAFSNNICELIQ